MSSRVTRACDGCRVRKVRCNGSQPCSQCAHLNLTCVFAPPPGKRKPGVRGRLVEQLRNSQQQQPQTNGKPSSSTASHAPTAGISPGNSAGSISPSATTPSVTSIAGIVNADVGVGPTATTAYTTIPANQAIAAGIADITSGEAGISHYTREYFLGYLPAYEEKVYPVNPVIPTSEIRTSIENMHANIEDCALVYAYAAITINLTSEVHCDVDISTEIATLVRLAQRAHQRALTIHDAGPLFVEVPTSFKRIMTCVFLEITMMAFKRWDRSLMILREAIALVQVLNTRQLGSLRTFTPLEMGRLHRVHWEVWIHERFLSTVSSFPCVMVPPDTVPLGDPAIPPHVDVGWNRLIQLFRILDGPFLAHWTAQKDPNLPVPEMTAQWIETKQAALDRDEAAAQEAQEALAASGGGKFTEVQHVDLFITRLWLRTLVWQFALHHGLLRSAPSSDTHEGLSLHFPAQRLSSQLRNLVSKLENVSNVVTHGSGILQKLFEITSTVADVLALPLGPGQTQEDARARLEDFEYLVRFMFSFQRIEKGQRSYLREKLGVLEQLYTIVDFTSLAGASPDA
ncbi:hypothetical protein K4F52_006582 [Lecanicillium sp. MT-2017a]|nr:hypothetical protein K4F52_006582 [Lecanicillium sp. MT-2017a]